MTPVVDIHPVSINLPYPLVLLGRHIACKIPIQWGGFGFRIVPITPSIPIFRGLHPVDVYTLIYLNSANVLLAILLLPYYIIRPPFSLELPTFEHPSYAVDAMVTLHASSKASHFAGGHGTTFSADEPPKTTSVLIRIYC